MTFNMGAAVEGKRFRTVRETARDLNLPEYFLRRMVRGGTCPGIFSGNRFYCDTPALVEQLSNLSAQRGAVDLGG